MWYSLNKDSNQSAGNNNADLKGATLEAVYQITLNQKGVSIEPNGKVRVTLPLSAELKGHKNLQIVRIGDDGTIKPMRTVCDGTNITFETDHFSTYGIVEIPQAAAKSTAQQETSSPQTGDNSPIQLLAVLTLSTAGAIALAVVRKKRYNY
jgi:LPXTG-motif cell wall-anchored protein